MIHESPFLGYLVSHDNTYGWTALAVRWNRFNQPLFPYTDEGKADAIREARKRNEADYQINVEDLYREDRETREELRHATDPRV